MKKKRNLTRLTGFFNHREHREKENKDFGLKTTDKEEHWRSQREAENSEGKKREGIRSK